MRLDHKPNIFEGLVTNRLPSKFELKEHVFSRIGSRLDAPDQSVLRRCTFIKQLKVEHRVDSERICASLQGRAEFLRSLFLVCVTSEDVHERLQATAADLIRNDYPLV